MSVSIYYEAKRAKPLSESEKQMVDEIVDKYSVDKLIEAGDDLNWESFGFSDGPHAPGSVLRGSTKLPDNSENAVWTGIQRWCAALSEIRRRLPDASWHVSVEDHEIPWDASTQAYDPSK